MSRTPTPESELENTLPENKDTVNKNSVNINSEVEGLINNTAGRTDAAAQIPAPLSGNAAPNPSTPAGKKRGKYNKKPRPDAPPPRASSFAAPVDEKKKIPPEVSARMLNAAYETTLVVVLGDEGKFDDGEKLVLDNALMEYLKDKNYEVPPLFGLCFCYATVTMSKMQKPKAKERAFGLWVAIKSRFGRNKLKEKQNEVK